MSMYNQCVCTCTCSTVLVILYQVPPCVNTEKTSAANGTEPLSVQIDPSKDTQTGTSTNTRIDVVTSNETNIHRRTKTIDVNTAEVTKDTYTSSSIILTERFVNTENNRVHNTSTQERPNTENITEPGKAKNVTDAEVAK